jgi:methyl-accepting chemotaxis protein
MANKKVKFELTAVDKTKAAFDKVTKGLKGVGGAAAGVTKGVAGIGIAAGATATALAFMVDKSFQAVDAIGKTATQTGIATDTLQAFHLAARESGTTIEGANTALIKFARSIGDAERGLKTQADIFKNIGVELRTTDGRMRSFESILEDTAKGIMELGSQSERASALANLFGRQGVILTGAITDLSENGIKKFIDRAKELGIVLSEKVIRRTEEFNDAVGVIKMQIGSFVNNITTSFLPVFEKMRESIAKFIQDSIDEAGGMDALGVKIANTVIEFVAKGIEHFGIFADGVATMVNDIKITLNEAAVAFFEFQMRMLQAIPFSNFEKEIFDLDVQASKFRMNIIELEKNTTEYGKAAKEIADKLREKKLTVDELKDSTDALTDSNGELGNSFTNLLSPTDKFLEQLEDVNLAIENAAVKSMKKMEDTILDGIKTGKLAFEDFASFVVEQLMRIAIQQMIIKPIATSLFGSLPSFDGGGYTGMGIRAGGLDGKGGSLAVVHPNETVIDHTKGQGMPSAPTVNFNISTVDAAGFDQLLASRKGLITSIINNAMNNQGKMGVV